MAPVHVLDHFYLAITLLVTVAYQLLGFAIAWTFQFDKITDFTGGSNFFILALLTLLLGNTYDARAIVASVLVMVWATRLAGFLLFRVLKTGSDTRFDDIRAHFLKFFGFWVGQIVWVWTVSLPLTILNSPAIAGGPAVAFGTGRDIAGIVLWAVGWLIETVADAQKFYHKSTSPPKDTPIDIGLWAWSRHPPYFGEMLCWWGLWTLSIAPAAAGGESASASAAQYGAAVSPVFTMLLLMLASGVPTAEKPQARRFFEQAYPLRAPAPGEGDGADSETARLAARAPANAAWENYRRYRAQTSILVPLPPALYRRLPRVVKRTVLLDWPMYEFRPAHDDVR